ncbi:MAG: type transport system ATP-binding protein [Thermoleophilaceae bacterium]|nr:type transport system ATP-binding protein [Thermoleophilaceae bacterium]
MSIFRRLPTTRLAALLLAVVALAVAGVAIAGAVGSSASPPPGKSLAEALHDALAAPPVEGVTADIAFKNSLVNANGFEGVTPLIAGATGRLWWSADERFRLELQGRSGDVQVVVDKTAFWVYDGTSNTLYRGTLPADKGGKDRKAGKEQGVPTVAQIQAKLTRVMKRVAIDGPTPGVEADRSSYSVKVTPLKNGGLLGGLELAWDAVRGTPLRAGVYAKGSDSPVLELKATSIDYGPVDPAAFSITPPAGAKVVDLAGKAKGKGDAGKRPSAAQRRAARKTARTHGPRAVQARLPFALKAPKALAGKPRSDVRLASFGDKPGAIVVYGQGLDSIVVVERQTVADAQQSKKGKDHGKLNLPTTTIGGAQATVLETALGTGLEWAQGGVTYTVAGSVTRDVAEAAARGLLLSEADAPPVVARGLVKRYGDVLAVDRVDLTVKAGDVYGYLGPNGAGKTTSLRMLLGLIRPTAGSARLFGRDPLEEGARALDGVAGFVEAPRFYPYLTGRRNLELCAAYDGGGARERIEDALGLVDLSDRARHKFGGYSHGMRQRLGIAAALLRAPRLLLLDEPTTGLDPAGMRDMRALVRRLAGEGITVLLSSHLLAEVEELCDRVAIIRSGRIVYEGSLAELKQTASTGYRLRTTDDERALAVARAQPGLERVEQRGPDIHFDAAEQAVGELSVALVEAGAAILALTPSAASLEELFFRLTEGDSAPEPAAVEA